VDRWGRTAILVVIGGLVVTAAVAGPRLLSARLFQAESRPGPGTNVSVDGGSDGCLRDPAVVGTVAADVARARVEPGMEGEVLARFGPTNEQGAPQVFLIEDRVNVNGGSWLETLLPIRPNGTRGYIQRDDLRLAQTPYRLVVDREARTLTLWDLCERVRTYPVGIGTKQTPTPVGEFYLTSLLRPPSPHSVYGSYAYGLSGFSPVVRDWPWGGLIGLHGTNDPSSIGSLASRGCIRMRNPHIEELVRILPLGTPITIT
jgi:lipoprotein-anchoring transpeptidase ErfK/SrfK